MIINNLSDLLAQSNFTITNISNETGISRMTLTKAADNRSLFVSNGRVSRLDVINEICEYTNWGINELLTFLPYDLALTFNGGFQLDNSKAWGFTVRVDVKRNGKIIQSYDLDGSLDDLGKVNLHGNNQKNVFDLEAKNIKIKGHEFETSEWFTGLPGIAKNALRDSLLLQTGVYFKDLFPIKDGACSGIFSKATHAPGNVDIL